MNKLSFRTIAIVLALGFFGVSSVVIGGIVLGYWFDDQTRSAPTRSKVQYKSRQVIPPADFDRGGRLYEETPERGGRLRAKVDGKAVDLPTMKTDYDVDIRGDLAGVTLRQTFENPTDSPMHATYQFPLNRRAAVHEMVMQVGDERVRAQIKKKEEAKKTYEEAKEEGKAAALLSQKRPNLFTQQVANLMPGESVDITLRYVHPLPREEGSYRLILPMVVGPRYDAGGGQANQLVDGEGQDQELPAHPPVAELSAPETVDPERVSVEVRIDGGMPVRDIESSSHAVEAVEYTEEDWRVELAEGRTLDNQHFRLRFRLAGEHAEAGVNAYWEEAEQTGYFSMLVEPPVEPPAEEVVSREMVFVLDCSGSMNGVPMDTNKAFMREALRNLRPTDHFRIVRFSSGASEYSSEPLKATDANIDRALEHIDQLRGTGGTEMTRGVEQALSVPVPDDTIRLVTFLTDGYIGNENEVLGLVGREIGDARLFAVGIGNGVNRYLLEEMGRMGRGFARFVDPQKTDEAVDELVDRLQTPVMTDLTVEWGDAGVQKVTPKPIPDLFAGESIRLHGQYTRPGERRVTLHGKLYGEPVAMPLEVELPAEGGDGESVKLTWARRTIADRMHQLQTPDRLRQPRKNDRALKDEITDLGLDYGLATQWTSFVAVSEKVVNADAKGGAEKQVPVAQAEGVSKKAYASGGPSAHSAPEPTFVGGLLVALCAAVAGGRRRDKPA